MKIIERGGLLAGSSGSSVHGKLFRDWFTGGCKGHPPNMGDPDGVWGEGFIIRPDDSVLVFGPSGAWLDRRMIDGFQAWGSGCEFAMGAMAAGATAEQAIAVAFKYDVNTGGEITVLRR